MYEEVKTFISKIILQLAKHFFGTKERHSNNFNWNYRCFVDNWNIWNGIEWDRFRLMLVLLAISNDKATIKWGEMQIIPIASSTSIFFFIVRQQAFLRFWYDQYKLKSQNIFRSKFLAWCPCVWNTWPRRLPQLAIKTIKLIFPRLFSELFTI